MSEEGRSKTLLVAFINRVKAIEDQRADLAADAADVCREAKGAGFEPTKVREVVRWLRRIDKHGRAKVDEAEAIFDLYRSAMGGTVKLEEVTGDAILRAMFAEDQVDTKLDKSRQRMRAALALAAASKAAGAA